MSLEKLAQAVTAFRLAESLTTVSGVVTEVYASHYRVDGLADFLELGDCVRIGVGRVAHVGQVVGVGKDGAIVKSFENGVSVGLKAPVRRLGPVKLAPHWSWRGRVLNALGAPIDDKEALTLGDRLLPVDLPPPQAMRRARAGRFVPTGVRAIDCFTPLCEGQRIGIFAGSGVGKSTLLAMLARAKGFDAVVICLVGERGREVRDFLDDAMASRSAATVTIVATGDESPMMRRLAPATAMTVAEFFRDAGESVLLIIDSVTRYAHASREVALAAGEPPVAHGYTPSVFADLPRLLERAGPGVNELGSITGLFSVLVDGDNHNEPIADCVRGTLDGHIVLDRDIADQGRYPAINVLKSISRLSNRIWSPQQRTTVLTYRALLSRYEDTRDLRMLGGYYPGADLELDRAITLAPMLYDALTQSPLSPPSDDAFREIAERLCGAASAPR